MGGVAVSPSMTKRVVGDISYFTVATIATQLISAVTAIVTRRFLGPAQFGVWAFVQVILMYADYSHLGTLTAISREIPFYRGKGDLKKVQDIKDAVFSFSFLSSVLVSGLIASASYFLRSRMSGTLFYCLLFSCGLAVLQRVSAVFISILRADKHFKLAGKQAVYSGMVNVLLVAFFSYRYELRGFLTAMALTHIFNTVYLWNTGLFRFRWSRDLGPPSCRARRTIPHIRNGWS